MVRSGLDSSSMPDSTSATATTTSSRPVRLCGRRCHAIRPRHGERRHRDAVQDRRGRNGDVDGTASSTRTRTASRPPTVTSASRRLVYLTPVSADAMIRRPGLDGMGRCRRRWAIARLPLCHQNQGRWPSRIPGPADRGVSGAGRSGAASTTLPWRRLTYDEPSASSRSRKVDGTGVGEWTVVGGDQCLLVGIQLPVATPPRSRNRQPDRLFQDPVVGSLIGRMRWCIGRVEEVCRWTNARCAA